MVEERLVKLFTAIFDVYDFRVDMFMGMKMTPTTSNADIESLLDYIAETADVTLIVTDNKLSNPRICDMFPGVIILISFWECPQILLRFFNRNNVSR